MKFSKAQKKILFLCPKRGYYFEDDINFLNKNHKVRILISKDLEKKWNIPIFYINLFLGILWADLIYIWFINTPTYLSVFLAKIFSKKTIVIIGGYEVAKIPEIQYGALINPKSANQVKYVFENVTKVLVVDIGLKVDAIQNLNIKGNNIEVVPTGFDYNKFIPSGVKENLVITSAYIQNWNTVRLKGIDTLVKSAILVPECKFIILGIENPNCLQKLKKNAPNNVEFKQFLKGELELIHLLQKAKIYCQLSMREGLPSTLCEAMLCECIPIGSEVQGVKSAIGDVGFLVPYGNPEKTATAIKKAIHLSSEGMIRKRIIENYSLEKRERTIIAIIESIT